MFLTSLANKDRFSVCSCIGSIVDVSELVSVLLFSMVLFFMMMAVVLIVLCVLMLIKRVS